MPATRSLRSAAWRVVELITTPLVPSDYLDEVAPLRNANVLRARIEEVHREHERAVTLVLRPGRGWRRHEPGQYLRIGVDVDGIRLWRNYSLTSDPDRADGRVSITVTAIEGGVVSNHLVRNARVGALVHLDPPAGEFTVPDPAPEKVLFVTAGSGVTPIMGILRGAGDRLRDVVVVHSARTAADALFTPELDDLAAEGRIRLIERTTSVEGRLSPAGIAALVPDWAERETWACGPNELLDELEKHWADAGVGERLRTERFRPVMIGADGAGGDVTFTKTQTTVTAPGDVPLLDAAEAAGVLMPSGCRMGICFGCVLPLREGAVRDLRDGALIVAEAGDTIPIQTCVSAAAGPCRIDH
ncbi:ferredoxin-NADP reductase [Catenuloplanes atrovinosus]|uniref:Ferredoxin-NADP reductase n=2 Tax=Catenuloplanes atrovinosus TaxID=137266 RepID=A0AAE3YQ87_9ACTN|nr:ferredoxin reductase [Catenuloplanes atrovinosus]MDR7277834.1 ferredoxin-NADP reductase [Catenuloplanes atrovinosus]